jgi:hypothetical protein
MRTVLILCSLVFSFARTRELFDFDWRFYLGAPGSNASCNASTFPVDYSGVQCLELTAQPGISSAAACEAVCCSLGESCQLWQYASSPGCWIGPSCDTNLTGPGWVGAGRVASPTPSCDAGSPCEPDYDDSNWRTLNVPHDFIIEGTFNPDINPSYGALPRNVSWYRKHFTLPDSWIPGETLVWLTFDGVFRAAGEA